MSFQDILNKRKDMMRKCNFRNKLEDIDNIRNILCTNRKNNMLNTFQNMIDIVEYILRRYEYGP